jgi:hypothetical protein
LRKASRMEREAFFCAPGFREGRGELCEKGTEECRKGKGTRSALPGEISADRIILDVTSDRADTADARGAQAHLMRCSDGNYYVVKFQNNPQHHRILVNEMLGTRLASRLGLTTATGATERAGSCRR